MNEQRGLKLKLPATSANLGPGFDAAGLAMSIYLTIEASVADTDQILAKGRDAALCGALENNLILTTYRDVLKRADASGPSLILVLDNEIPLGMGCGSSAAALCAGVALADHFGSLGLGDAGIVAEASQLEGHPDNVAACWYGGFTVSAINESGRVETATFSADFNWQMMLAMQSSSLATKKARALLPETYSKSDAVFNVQRTALLTAAFAQGRLDLLNTAMRDRIHQPYRMEACPLLKALLPLADAPEFAGVALSGAGPSVLLILSKETSVLDAELAVRGAAGEAVELLTVRVADGVERTLF
jgi:homoserine kinase